MGKTRKTKKTKPIRLYQLTNGVGNKLFELVNILHYYGKKYTIYFVEKPSHHKDLKLKVAFPNIPNLISWYDYDKYRKEGVNKIITDTTIWLDDIGFHPPPAFLQMNSSYDSLLQKYDFENGIFIHARYGDKFQWNYTQLKINDPRLYILLKPSYYMDAVKQFTTKGPLYVFSDSSFAKCLLQDVLSDAIFVEEGVFESFFCLSHCKHLILSDSTFGIAAVYLNSNPVLKVVAPGYTNNSYENNLKIIKTPYHYPVGTHLVKDKSYILENTLKTYEEIIDRCKLKMI